MLQPGDYIGGAEELAAGEGTYNSNDEIYSSVFGMEACDGRDAKVSSQKSVRNMKPGDEVYGIITDVMDSKALVAVVPISDDKRIRFSPGDTAALRVQDIADRYVKFVKDEFRVGDLIRARVVSTTNGIDLTTQGSSDYGVIKAFCSKCRNVLVLKENKLMCRDCERPETRKLSKYYLVTGE